MFSAEEQLQSAAERTLLAQSRALRVSRRLSESIRSDGLFKWTVHGLVWRRVDISNSPFHIAVQVLTKHNFVFDNAIVFQYPACYKVLLAALTVESFTNTARIGLTESLNKRCKGWFVCESDTDTAYCIHIRSYMVVYRSEHSSVTACVMRLNSPSVFFWGASSGLDWRSSSVLLQVHRMEVLCGCPN